jgi:subtilisin family serine protease
MAAHLYGAPPRQDVASTGAGAPSATAHQRHAPVISSYHLKVPADVARLLNADKVHAAGTTVFSSGNGHYAFPSQMKEVLSAGGVFVPAFGPARASDYASAFESLIYSGRSVPDFCGLVGLLPHADYIAMPVPAKCEIDRDTAAHDGTSGADGWGVFSGTSAAAPQLAGVCALLLEKDPSLTPSEIKAILTRTSRDVAIGHGNPASDPGRAGVPATAGRDGATGAGLVDAFAAWQQL